MVDNHPVSLSKKCDFAPGQSLPCVKGGGCPKGRRRDCNVSVRDNPPVKNQRFLPAPFTQGGLYAAGRSYLRVDALREEQRAMPAYEEPPVLPGGSCFLEMRQIVV